MEQAIWMASIAFMTLVLVPVLLFRPVLVALANRISGKSAAGKQLEVMQKRIDALEDQLGHMQARLAAVEEGHDFSRRLLENISAKTSGEAAKEPPKISQSKQQ